MKKTNDELTGLEFLQLSRSELLGMIGCLFLVAANIVLFGVLICLIG